MFGRWKKSKEGDAHRIDPVFHDEPDRSFAPDPEKIGWVSPKYHMSRRARLEPEVLEAKCISACFPDAPVLDYYRTLRGRILRLTAASGGNTLLITSALPGEGKTLTAINLAFAVAKEYQKTVLLVDCDLKRQDIHRRLGIAGDRGLIDYLLDDRPLSEIMIWPGVEKVTLISGGRTVRESSELLGSQRMQELTAEMKKRYPERMILFDLPPVLSGADTPAFAPQADHILMVVRAGSTPQREIRRALALLPPEKILGLVLNRQPVRSVPGYESYESGGKK